MCTCSLGPQLVQLAIKKRIWYGKGNNSIHPLTHSLTSWIWGEVSSFDHPCPRFAPRSWKDARNLFAARTTRNDWVGTNVAAQQGATYHQATENNLYLDIATAVTNASCILFIEYPPPPSAKNAKNRGEANKIIQQNSPVVIVPSLRYNCCRSPYNSPWWQEAAPSYGTWGRHRYHPCLNHPQRPLSFSSFPWHFSPAHRSQTFVKTTRWSKRRGLVLDGRV